MDNSTINTDLIRGHVTTIILKSLQELDRYGYEICREIELKTDGNYKLKQPTLYSCLKRLESQGYIDSYWGEVSNGGRRKYYTLTNNGKVFLEKDKSEWEYSRTLINRLLSDKEYDLSSPPPFDASELRPNTKKSTNSNLNILNTSEETQAQSNYKFETDNEPLSNNNFDNSIDTGFNNQNESNVSDDIKNTTIDKDAKDNNTSLKMDSSNDSSIIENNGTSSDKYSENIEQINDSSNFEELPSSVIQCLNDENFSIQVQNDETIKQIMESEINEDIVLNKDLQKDIEDTSLFPQDVIDINSAIMQESNDNSNENIIISNNLIGNNVQLKIEDINLSAEKNTFEKEMNDKKNANSTFAESINYKSMLSKLVNYASKSNSSEMLANTENTLEEPVNSNSEKPASFNELQSKFYSEGYKLRPYSKSNANTYYSMAFLYCNKISLAASLLVYISILTGIALAYFVFADILNFPDVYYLYGTIGAFIIPLIATIKFLFNPSKKSKAKFDFKNSLFNRIILYVNITLIIICLGFLLFKVNIQDFDTIIIPIILPLFFLLNLPFSSVIYYILYESKKFHLS